MLVSNKEIGLLIASRISIRPKRNIQNVFMFGVTYALGSLSCTLPIFLIVVGSALTNKSPLNSLVHFLSYALGMGVVIVGVTVGAAIFRGAIGLWLKATLPYFQRMSVLFLIGAGAYLIYYWVIYWG